MNKQPTNGELAILINGLREVVEVRFDQNDKDHNAVNKRLKKLNGQVAKNTSFRSKWSGVYIAVSVFGVSIGIVATIINII